MKRTLKDALKIYYALPPHDTGRNICAFDGYFWQSIKGKWSADEISKTEKELISQGYDIKNRTIFDVKGMW